VRSPNLNSLAERFVSSIESECVSKLVLPDESHLRHAVSEYVVHYRRERNHQGMSNRLFTRAEEAVLLRCTPRDRARCRSAGSRSRHRHWDLRAGFALARVMHDEHAGRVARRGVHAARRHHRRLQHRGPAWHVGHRSERPRPRGGSSVIGRHTPPAVPGRHRTPPV
jgi:hypothetical protein